MCSKSSFGTARRRGSRHLTRNRTHGELGRDQTYLVSLDLVNDHSDHRFVFWSLAKGELALGPELNYLSLQPHLQTVKPRLARIGFFPLVICLSLVLFGCGKSEVSFDAVASSSRNAPADAKPVAEAPQNEGAVKTIGMQVPSGRQVIRTADLAVRVKRIEPAEEAIRKYVTASGGYVDSASSSELNSDHPTMSLTLRVPVSSFDISLEKLESLGVRLSKSISSEDVTNQIVDLDARLKTLSAQEETYRELLKASRNIDAVIKIQDKLTEVRGTIESMAAQRKTMASQAALSTINVTLTQDVVPGSTGKDPGWLAQTWAEATTSAGSALKAVIGLGVWIIVFSPAWLLILWFVRKMLRASKPPRIAP